ncbi:SRP40, C-terminal domain-containing protein [Lactifluus volemus]|nr:SRP40, C-terminal domain-containing protein [Lactifluus volemus]
MNTVDDLAYTYTLVHAFLKERSHKKAASALKKAVTGIVTIDDKHDEHEGSTLLNILKEWRKLKRLRVLGSSTSSDSDSVADSSSSGDDSEVEDNLAVKSAGKLKPSDSAGINDDDSDDTVKKVTPQVENAKELRRDSSKTLSSLDDVGDEPSDESDSDIDSVSDSVSDSDDGKNKKQTVSHKKLSTSSSDITSSSSSDSSNEDDELEKKTHVPIRTAKPSFGPDSSSSSDSDSDSDSDEGSEPLKVNQMKRKAISSNSDSTSDSGSESDSSESSSPSSRQERMKILKKPSAVQAVAGSSSTSGSSDSEPEDELEDTPALSATPDPDSRVTKKRRTNEEGSATVTATTVTVSANKVRGGKASRKSNTPFQRVKVEMTEYHDENLRDNTFESRAARPDDYGAKAHRDLIVTRGDGFRKEKNKKKRGSYRGGNITLESHSFKFED